MSMLGERMVSLSPVAVRDIGNSTREEFMLGQQQQSVLGNGLKLLGEILVPGASEMLEGKLGSGLAHNVIAGAATLALVGVSPVLAGMTVLAVKANSFSRSVNGRNLWSALNSEMGDDTTTDSAGTSTATSSPARRPAGASS
jgi:hypothetical protein